MQRIPARDDIGCECLHLGEASIATDFGKTDLVICCLDRNAEGRLRPLFTSHNDGACRINRINRQGLRQPAHIARSVSGVDDDIGIVESGLYIRAGNEGAPVACAVHSGLIEALVKFHHDTGTLGRTGNMFDAACHLETRLGFVKVDHVVACHRTAQFQQVQAGIHPNRLADLLDIIGKVGRPGSQRGVVFACADHRSFEPRAPNTIGQNIRLTFDTVQRDHHPRSGFNLTGHEQTFGCIIAVDDPVRRNTCRGIGEILHQSIISDGCIVACAVARRVRGSCHNIQITLTFGQIGSVEAHLPVAKAIDGGLLLDRADLHPDLVCGVIRGACQQHTSVPRGPVDQPVVTDPAIQRDRNFGIHRHCPRGRIDIACRIPRGNRESRIIIAAGKIPTLERNGPCAVCRCHLSHDIAVTDFDHRTRLRCAAQGHTAIDAGRVQHVILSQGGGINLQEMRGIYAETAGLPPDIARPIRCRGRQRDIVFAAAQFTRQIVHLPCAIALHRNRFGNRLHTVLIDKRQGISGCRRSRHTDAATGLDRIDHTIATNQARVDHDRIGDRIYPQCIGEGRRVVIAIRGRYRHVARIVAAHHFGRRETHLPTPVRIRNIGFGHTVNRHCDPCTNLAGARNRDTVSVIIVIHNMPDRLGPFGECQHRRSCIDGHGRTAQVNRAAIGLCHFDLDGIGAVLGESIPLEHHFPISILIRCHHLGDITDRHLDLGVRVCRTRDGDRGGIPTANHDRIFFVHRRQAHAVASSARRRLATTAATATTGAAANAACQNRSGRKCGHTACCAKTATAQQQAGPQHADRVIVCLGQRCRDLVAVQKDQIFMRAPFAPSLGRAILGVKNTIAAFNQRDLAKVTVSTDEQPRNRRIALIVTFEGDNPAIRQCDLQIGADPGIAGQFELPDIERDFFSGRDLDHRGGSTALDHTTPGCAHDGTHDKIHCLHDNTALLVTRRFFRRIYYCL